MIFHYLWYKLYRAALRSFQVEWAAIFYSAITWAALIHLNIATLSMFLAKLDILPFMYQPDTNQALHANTTLMALSYVYFRFRSKTIIDRFSKETDEQRDKGTFWVILYVALSIALAIGIGGAYKPGYLPTW